jgi:hypothetical protein
MAHLQRALGDLFRELTHGPPAELCWVLNPGDRGLLKSLDALSADAASARKGGRSSIAAHVDHLRYGFSLMNRWGGGEENPFATADFAASWRRQTVSETEWRELRGALAKEISAWDHAITQPRDLDLMGLTGMIASIVHLAYHLGAIRQIDAAASGPPASD